MERKTFASKNYDGASYFKYLADELEQFEKIAYQDKLVEKFERQEKILRKKQENFMINFLKRVQRDRDEQLCHRQQDSKILIQRNKNMLRDMNKRHQIEYKKTVEFLKYALGNKAPKPAKNLILSDNTSMMQS